MSEWMQDTLFETPIFWMWRGGYEIMGESMSIQIDDGHGELVQPEPAPVPNDKPAVWDLVIEDMKARDEMGRAKYGTPLQPHNGRDVLVDMYQEALDLTVYIRQAIFERDGR